MTPEERIALNIRLYQRFLGHEGHEMERARSGAIAPTGEWLWCRSCAEAKPVKPAWLRDLTTDGNAMLELKATLTAAGYTVYTIASPAGGRVYLYDQQHRISDVQVDPEPEALALAIAQIPEATS